MTLVAIASLPEPIIRRTLLRVTIEKKKALIGKKHKVTIELGSSRPGGQVRWNNLTKLTRNINTAQRDIVSKLALQLIYNLTIKTGQDT